MPIKFIVNYQQYRKVQLEIWRMKSQWIDASLRPG